MKAAVSGNPLLMGCSTKSLRAKLNGAPFAQPWPHFLALAREDSGWHAPYTALAALVTQLPEDRERARQAVLNLVTAAPEAFTSYEAQFHTHVMAAPLGRWAIFYSWLAEEGVFTPAEEESIAAAMLDLAYVFPFQSLQSRMQAFDNQLLANAFTVASVGYVFGFKHGSSARGQQMFHTGIAWLKFLLDNLPEGGYSPEGSTYHEQIVLPMVLLASQLVAETAHFVPGADGVPAISPALLELLQTSYRMIGPSGLLPAFDAYGFQRAMIKCGLAFLARVTGDGTPLSLIDDQHLWHYSAHPAWEIDDPVWTLVWWPETTDTASVPFRPWMAPAVGGALQHRPDRVRLFQCWDRCGGVPSSGRAQVDPNAVTFEAFGVPLLLDGAGHPGAAAIPIPTLVGREYVGARILDTIREYCNAPAMTDEDALSYAFNGSVGMSNSLVFDDEGWFVPFGERVGRGEALHSIGPLQVIRSDATDFYRDRYDAKQVTRTSLLLKGRSALVTDRVIAKAPHSLTWQAYGREQVRQEDDRCIIETAERVGCDLIPLQDGALTLTPVQDYPNQWAERRSVLMRHTLPAACEARIDVALVPQNLLEALQDITPGWQRHIGDAVPETVDLDTAYLSDNALHPDSPRVFKKTVRLEAPIPPRAFLRVDIAGRGVRLAVNGQSVAPTTENVGSIWDESATGQCWLFDVSDALRAGDNEFAVSAPFMHGETLAGPVQLCIETPPLPVEVIRTAADTFTATVGEETDHFISERQGEAPWLDGRTDARYALLTAGGEIAAAEVSSLSLPDRLEMHSQAPCDFAWNGQETHLAKIVEGTAVTLTWPGAELHAEIGGSLRLTYSGSGSHRLHVELDSPRLLLLNGEILDSNNCTTSRDPQTGSYSVEVELRATPAAQTAQAPASAEEVYALAAKTVADRDVLLIAALRSDDWRVQTAAAECCGRLALRAAVPALLELFAASEADLPYPALSHWWRWSKMRRGGGDLNFEPDRAEPPALAVKRWRVRRAVVTALGKIGDPRAVAPLEAALGRGDDFFTVTSQLPVALGRLGSPASIPALQRQADHAEVNTRTHARLALALLRGEIPRSEFEQKVGLG